MHWVMQVVTRFVLIIVVVALGGCSGNAGIGASCDRHGDCADGLQCAQHVCMPRCQRATDCGDGFACNSEGVCVAATRGLGQSCTSEVECESGLSCQLAGSRTNANGRLVASCEEQNVAAPAGSECKVDNDCRNGTCALGRCIDLCSNSRDCAAGTSCMPIPRVDVDDTTGQLFDGCFLSEGVATWNIPMNAAAGSIYFPVPGGAKHASLVMSVPEPNVVGAVRVDPPFGEGFIYQMCPDPNSTTCDGDEFTEQYFKNRVRHHTESGTAVLAMPSSEAAEDELQPGAYRISLSSFTKQPFNKLGPSTAVPSLTAVVRMDDSEDLDLHFYFLDLDDHPCQAAWDDRPLEASFATYAQNGRAFQQYVDELKRIFRTNGVTVGALDYTDITNHPELSSPSLAEADTLLRLGKYPRGVNIFFVRSLAPVGIQAYSPSPGPGGVGGTRKSGVIIALDTLCYRRWDQLARLTAHEVARYMGLSRNVEIGYQKDPRQQDPILDSDDSSDNLMFFSELGGTTLSPGQRKVLLRSPVLR